MTLQGIVENLEWLRLTFPRLYWLYKFSSSISFSSFLSPHLAIPRPCVAMLKPPSPVCLCISDFIFSSIGLLHTLEREENTEERGKKSSKGWKNSTYVGQGARIIQLGREKLVSGLKKLFKTMKGYYIETGDQLFSLLLRRKQKEKVFNFSRREWGWI